MSTWQNSQYDNRFFLMGLGTTPVMNDSELIALNRHWDRLNYGNVGQPQAFAPSYCMVGLSHMVYKSKNNRWFWETLTYQVNDQFETTAAEWFGKSFEPIQ